MLEPVAAILDESQSVLARCHACFSIAEYYKRLSEDGGEGAEKAVAMAEEYFERVCVEFADVPSYRGTMTDLAEGELFELKNLALGMVAPEIEGEDLDGVDFKLSDYRGKVVVIDFWGDW